MSGFLGRPYCVVLDAAGLARRGLGLLDRHLPCEAASQLTPELAGAGAPGPAAAASAAAAAAGAPASGGAVLPHSRQAHSAPQRWPAA